MSGRRGTALTSDSTRAAVAGAKMTANAAGTTYTVSPFDVMTFDDDGLITTMRAFWDADDMVVSG